MAKIGLQLYSIKEECQKDFLGTLRRVAEIGYTGVEFAGYFDTSADELQSLLDEINLFPAGAHINIRLLENDLDNVIAYAKTIGCPAVICPSFRIDETNLAGTFNTIAELFNRVGQACDANGLQFQYHMHGHEFVPVGETTGMQMLLDKTDPDLVWFEPDTTWVEKAGVRVVQFIEEHGPRVSYIHLKDFTDRTSWHDTEIGAGQLDTPGVIAAANKFNLPWYIVEQEAYDMPMMESIGISLKNLRQLIG